MQFPAHTLRIVAGADFLKYLSGLRNNFPEFSGFVLVFQKKSVVIKGFTKLITAAKPPAMGN